MKKLLDKTFVQILIAYFVAVIFSLAILFVTVNVQEHIRPSPTNFSDAIQVILVLFGIALFALATPFALSFDIARGLTQTEPRTSEILNDPFYYLSLIATIASIGCFYLVHKKVKRPFKRIVSFSFLFGVWIIAGAYLFTYYIGE